MQIIRIPTRQHELDHTRSGIDPPHLADLDHQVGIDDLSLGWRITHILGVVRFRTDSLQNEGGTHTQRR